MNDTPRLFIQLYTDEDITTALAIALREKGFTAQSTHEANMLEKDDEAQLQFAASHQMAIMTRNEKDFALLARKWKEINNDHWGIIITGTFTREQFGELLRQTLHLLDTQTSDDLRNAFVYLSQFH